MNITTAEKLMFKVMKAIFDSGIPVSFKGSMVLKACLIEAGYDEETRHTVDIDANWNTDTAPSAEQMVESIQNALVKGRIELRVKLYRMYGEGRSAGFELSDPDMEEILFTMDIDVNRPLAPTKIYEVESLRFRGVAPIQMIADKISVVSSYKVFRRIKDVVDLYYISKVFDLNVSETFETLRNSGRVLGNFDGFINRSEELRHSYEKFRFAGDVIKPGFDEVYETVKRYLSDLLQQPNRSY